MSPVPTTDAPRIMIVDDDEAMRRSLRFLFASVRLDTEAWDSASGFFADWNNYDDFGRASCCSTAGCRG